MMRIVLDLALFVIIAWPAVSYAGDYDTAFRKFKVPAGQGDVGSQYLLGFMYADGQGVPQSNEELTKRGLDRLL